MAILKAGKTIGVVVHHSVYKPANNLTELKAQAKLFDGWHKSKSWAETIKTGGEFGYQYVEYHYLLGLDGTLLQVQDEKYVLYHSGDNFRGVNSFNLHGVAVCLTGNYENDVPTEAQMKTLVALIRDVQKRYGIDALVRGHKQTSQSATACPGKNIGTNTSGWLKQVIANVNNQAYPPVVPTPDPVVPPVESECEKRVKILETEIEGLRIDLGASEEETSKLRGAVVNRENVILELEGEIGELKDEASDLEGALEELKKERDRIEREKLDLQEKLDKIGKESIVKRIVNIIVKFFNKN